MPTLAQMEAATPKCPVIAPDLRGPHGRRLPGPRCGRPCRYDAPLNLWRCPVHDDVLAGELLAAIATGANVYLEVPR